MDLCRVFGPIECAFAVMNRNSWPSSGIWIHTLLAQCWDFRTRNSGVSESGNQTAAFAVVRGSPLNSDCLCEACRWSTICQHIVENDLSTAFGRLLKLHLVTKRSVRNSLAIDGLGFIKHLKWKSHNETLIMEHTHKSTHKTTRQLKCTSMVWHRWLAFSPLIE